jgi:hypothetical protein
MLKNEDGLFHSECASIKELKQVLHTIRYAPFKATIAKLIEERKLKYEQ